MEYLLGFLIGTAVGLTGVGAGSLTAPILILFFHLTPQQSVGTALTFAALIKLAVAPVYFYRKQVHMKTLLLLCAGGVPGVIAGYYAIRAFSARDYQDIILLILGITIASLALYSLYRAVRRVDHRPDKDHSGWLPLISAGIGTEVGFSSAGAGALGSVVLLNLTSLTPARVVGTDMVFGMVVSVVGGGFHLSAGNFSSEMLYKLIIPGLVGAFVGANLSSMLPARPLRLALSLWLTWLGGELCWRAISRL